MKTLIAALLMLATTAHAEDAAPTEQTTLGTSTITLTVWPFLSEDELTVLRLVATDANALALFVPDAAGFSALAASPDDGFIRDGVPVASAIALSGLADAETARTNALAACAEKKAGAADCVVVLEIAPAN
ncbi:MAG: hypothetical protein ACRCS3_10025 [Paracoccaceae bacterium]